MTENRPLMLAKHTLKQHLPQKKHPFVGVRTKDSWTQGPKHKGKSEEVTNYVLIWLKVNLICGFSTAGYAEMQCNAGFRKWVENATKYARIIGSSLPQGLREDMWQEHAARISGYTSSSPFLICWVFTPQTAREDAG